MMKIYLRLTSPATDTTERWIYRHTAEASEAGRCFIIQRLDAENEASILQHKNAEKVLLKTIINEPLIHVLWFAVRKFTGLRHHQ